MSCELIRVDFKKRKVKSRKILRADEEKDVVKNLEVWIKQLEDVLLMLHDDDGIALDNISVIVHNADNPILIPADISAEALVASLEGVKQKLLKQAEKIDAE